MKNILFLVIPVFFITIFTGCEKSKKTINSPTSENSTLNTYQAENKNIEPLPDKGRKDDKTQIREYSGLNYAFSLQQYGFDAEIYPNDFKIGVLEQTRDEEFVIASKFCYYLVNNEIDKKSVKAYNYELIKKTARPVLEKIIVLKYFRMGIKKRIDAGELFYTVRFFSDTGNYEGEIYMENTEGQWIITDIQIDFLGMEKNAGSKKFIPDAYRPDIEF